MSPCLTGKATSRLFTPPPLLTAVVGKLINHASTNPNLKFEPLPVGLLRIVLLDLARFLP